MVNVNGFLLLCHTGCFVTIISVFLIKATKYGSDIAHSQNTLAQKITVDPSAMQGVGLGAPTPVQLKIRTELLTLQKLNYSQPATSADSQHHIKEFDL